MTVTATPVFTAPGQGAWMSLRDHFPRAVTPEYARLLTTAMRDGEAVPMAAYGLPVKSLMVGLVHGHVYITPEPLIGKPSSALPPAPLLWLAARLVPAFRRRTKAAQRTLIERPWRADAKRWYATERQGWIDSNRALQAVTPEDLDDAALVEHLSEVRAHATAGYRRHFELHGPDLMPTGLLLACCDDWGIGPDLVLPVLAGSSPASMGQGPELDALRAAVAANGPTADTVEALAAVAGPELDAFLADHGHRLVTGYDLDSLTLGELPTLVVSLSRPAVVRAAAEQDDSYATLRQRVPDAHHEELDTLVADARATFGIRDDNGALTGAWPVGLLRRAMLAAGRRLAEGNTLRDPSHALEATVDELQTLLTGSTVPTADEVASRAKDRAERSELVPPLSLGPDLDIPVSVLPAPMRAVSRAQLILRDSFTAAYTTRAKLEGDGIGGTVHQGRAVVAADPGDALSRLEPGDVLVAYGTTPAYNLALSIAGAVVVEEGGLLSHAAVIARELNLPAVIGAAGCMDSIPDGAMVEVDATTGRVRVL
ncbi:MAG: PEP-utilizing enzyme [Acidimicrobiales bacterium]